MYELDISDLLITGMTTYGPVTLSLAMFLGTLGIPVPLPLLALAAGSFAQYGSINWGLAIFSALAGATLGDSLGYVVGRFASEWAEDRYGETQLWRRSKSQFHRNGDLAIFITRFLLTPLAVPTNLIAGVSRYPFRRFFVFTVAGTLIFIVFFGGLGYAFSRQWEFIGELIHNYFGWLVVAATISSVAYILARRLVRDKRRWAAHPPAPKPDELHFRQSKPTRPEPRSYFVPKTLKTSDLESGPLPHDTD